jgi:hypothetical protein
MADDEHDEEEESPNMFGNSGEEEDPWRGSVFRDAVIQLEKSARARQTAVLRAIIRDLKPPKDDQPELHFSSVQIEQLRPSVRPRGDRRKTHRDIV